MSLIETSGLSGLEFMAVDYGLKRFREYANANFLHILEVDFEKFVTDKLTMIIGDHSFKFKVYPEESEEERIFGWLQSIYTDTFEIQVVGMVNDEVCKQLVTSHSLSQDELEEIVILLALLTSD